MTNHNDYMTWQQGAEIARQLMDLKKAQRKSTRAASDLRHAALDGARLPVKDEQGNTTGYLGSGPTGIEHVNGPDPATPAVPFVDAGGEVVKIQHSGLDHEDSPGPADWRRTIVHVALGNPNIPGFIGTRAGYIDDMDGSFSHRLPGGEWWIAVQWETLSGKLSPVSEPVLADVAPLVDTGDIEDALETAQERLDEYREQVAEPAFQALQEGLNTNADNISDATERLTEAENTIRPLPGRMETAEANVESARDEAAAAAAAAVEANNRSMTRLANGNFENDLLYWEHQNVTLTDVAHSGQTAVTIGASGWLSPESSFPVVVGQIWELSMYHQGNITVLFESVSGGDRTTLGTHTITGVSSSWSDSGALRVTIPADVHMLSFTITGTAAIVDDITLRDVTDVVRLEEAANANRQKAEQAISELAVLQLAVDGEGGLKDRLTTAESTLETKADESALDQLDQKLAGNLAAFEAHYTRVWRQPTPPPAGTHYAWEGEPHASVSVRLDGDGNETARNVFTRPRDFAVSGSDRSDAVDLSTPGRIEVLASNYINAYSWALQTWTKFIDDPDFAEGEYERTYTMSVEVKAHVQHPEGYYGLRFDLRTPTIHYSEPGRIEDTGGEWVRVSTTLTLGADLQGDRSLFNFTDGANHTPGDVIEYRDWKLERGSQATPYFDGSTPSDRAHDLWYNTDGVPHEWENGTNGEPGGWVELSDDRINQLQTDVIEAAQTAYLDRLVVRDEIVTPETITNRLWAELGVFNRLQAREGWIGGTNLADGAVTAEKIHATRELITKIMGAEWAYISERLVVDGSILTRDLEALSAAIQSLTVTQRADIAELWAEELWTALAVIETLQSEEAWITSAMISELTAEKVTVTENFVGRVAELLHLVVDRIDVNSLWADQTWQAAGHFGSEEADQSTLVDGTGLRITKHDHDNETSTDIVRLGGEGVGLVFSDEDGEVTGSLSHEGDASFRDTSVDRLTIGGRLLLPETDPAEFWDGNLWDSQPKGLICFHEVNMRGVNVNHIAYGFIEVSHQVYANRRYKVNIDNIRLSGNGTYYGHFKYTIGEQPAAPHTQSPQLGQSWFIRNTDTSGVGVGGQHIFVPEEDGLIRILFVVEGGNAGIQFNGISGYNQIQMSLEDLGPSRPYTGMARVAGHGGSGTVRDPQPLTGAITTEFEMSWYQNYSHGGTRRRSSSENSGGYGSPGPTQGRRQDLISEGFWSSLFGFNTSTDSNNSADIGVTLPAILNGATIISAHLEVKNHLAWHPNKNTRYGFAAHNHASAPNQYSAQTLIAWDVLIQEGSTARIPLPLDVVEPLARSGDLTGFGIETGATGHTYSGILGWREDARPKLVVTYQR